MRYKQIKWTADELKAAMKELNVTPKELARYLNYSPRTIHRYLKGEKIYGPVQCAIEAWIKLQRNGIPWRVIADPENEIDIASLVK